jgi:hypothetical protein
MLKHILLASSLCIALVACKKDSKETTGAAAATDHSDPVKVVEQIFAAASSGSANALPGLCDPAGTGDGDVKRVCGAKPGDPKWDEFKSYFAKGKVDGAAQIEGDKAAVKFQFGPDGTKQETMNLKKIDGKWYLASF